MKWPFDKPAVIPYGITVDIEMLLARVEALEAAMRIMQERAQISRALRPEEIVP